MKGKYPEHEKLRARQSEALLLGNFLDMLDEEGLAICERTPHVRRGFEWERTPRSKDALIGLALGIGPAKLATEKEAMYQEMTK